MEEDIMHIKVAVSNLEQDSIREYLLI